MLSFMTSIHNMFLLATFKPNLGFFLHSSCEQDQNHWLNHATYSYNLLCGVDFDVKSFDFAVHIVLMTAPAWLQSLHTDGY